MGGVYVCEWVCVSVAHVSSLKLFIFPKDVSLDSYEYTIQYFKLILGSLCQKKENVDSFLMKKPQVKPEFISFEAW